MIALDLSSTINDTDNISIPTSYDLGISGGSYSCKETTTNTTITNSNELLIGSRNINCTITKNNGLKKTVTKTIAVSGYYDATKKLGNAYDAYKSGTSIIIPESGGVQYGPYKQFETGVYLVTINGNNLNNVKTIVAYYSGGTYEVTTNIQKLTSHQIVYKIDVTSNVSNMEFVLRDTNGGSITIDNITVTKSDTFNYVFTGNCTGGMCAAGGATTSGSSIILTASSHYTWGPYIPLSKGNYEVTIYGNNVDKISKLDFHDYGINSYTSGTIISSSSTMVKYKVLLTTDYINTGAEVYISGSDGNTITIDKYLINKIND